MKYQKHKRKNIKIFKFLICVFYFFCLSVGMGFLIFCFAGCSLNQKIYKSGEVIINNQIIKVEIADRPELMRKGLSGRDGLAENQGMLFIFDKIDIYEFWMQDMKFPLDIIWLKTQTYVDDAQTDTDRTRTNTENQYESVIGEIVEIWQNAPIPRTGTDKNTDWHGQNEIPRYRPKNLANYVLEVNAGIVERYGWKIGDKIIINYKP